MPIHTRKAKRHQYQRPQDKSGEFTVRTVQMLSTLLDFSLVDFRLQIYTFFLIHDALGIKFFSNVRNPAPWKTAEWNETGIEYPRIHFQCQWNTLARHTFSCTYKLQLCLDKLISLTSKNPSSDFRKTHTNCTFAVGSLKVRYFNGISTLFRHYFDTFRV